MEKKSKTLPKMITKSQKISRDSKKKGGPGGLKTQKGICVHRL